MVAVTVATAGDAANNTADATNDSANRSADATNDTADRAADPANDATNRTAHASDHTANASNNTSNWRATAGAASTRGPAVAAIPARTIAATAAAACVSDADRTGAARSRVRGSPDSRGLAIRGAARTGNGAGITRQPVGNAMNVEPHLTERGRNPRHAMPCSGGLALLQ
jgi:hypothetical protein